MFSFQAEAPVTCVAAARTEPLVLAGCQDGKVLLVNAATGKLLRTLAGHRLSVESVGFVNLGGAELPVTASADRTIKVWEPSGAERGSCEHGAGLVRIKCHPTLPVIFACSSDGVAKSWDARNCQPIATFTGHVDAILDLCLSQLSSSLHPPFRHSLSLTQRNNKKPLHPPGLETNF